MLSHLHSGQRKKSTKINFWGPETAGVFHAEGWGLKSSAPPSKVCLPWVSKDGTWDGCSGSLGLFKKFVQKKVRAHFSTPSVSSSLMGSLAKGFLRKVCGNSAEISRKFGQKIRSIASGKGAEILRKVCANFAEIFCKDPFPNDPTNELLIVMSANLVRGVQRILNRKGLKNML